MAVVLMESASVIGAVRSLTSWYGVMAETITVFCGTIFVETGEFQIFSSAGATGPAGHSSFFVVQGSMEYLWAGN